MKRVVVSVTLAVLLASFLPSRISGASILDDDLASVALGRRIPVHPMA